MGRIISGGLKGFKPTSQKQSQEIPSAPAESTSEYFQRNLAKVPALAYQTARSGFGLGDLLNLVNEKSQQAAQQYQDYYPQSIMQAGQGISNLAQLAKRAVLPTGQEAQQESQKLAGFIPGVSPEKAKYLTERRPEDYPAEFALMELPRIIASAGAGGIPAGAKAIGRSLGLFGGSEVGHRAGGALGELVGQPELGQIAGGIAGGHYGQKLANIAANRPSKYFPDRVAEAENKAFEAGKGQRLAEAEKEFSPKITAQELETRKATLALPKEKSAFMEAKKGQINDVRKEIQDYKNKIKSLDESRKPNYDAAAKLDVGIKGNASNVLSTINEIEDEIRHGVAKADRKSIYDSLNDLEQSVNKGKGELPLRVAKQFQKNFNDQIYNFGASNSYKRQMTKAVNSLNDFIKQNGSPEHNKLWQDAEQATKDYKNLKRNQNEFIKSKNQIISDLNKQQFSPEKETILKREAKEAGESLKNIKQQKDQAISAIGKESYDKLLKSEADQNKLASSISELAKSNTGKFGLSGLAATLGYLTFGNKGAILAGLTTAAGHELGKQIQIARKVFKDHPDIYKGYIKEINQLGKKDIASMVLRVNQLGHQIEKYAKESPQEEKPRKGIISGGLKFKH